MDERRRKARARRSRRRRVVAAGLLVALIAVTAAYVYLTSDERVGQFAEEYLTGLFGTRVSVRRASFSLLARSVVLEDLKVYPPAPFEEPILTAEQVDLQIDPLALVRMRLDVKEIVIHRPKAALVLWNRGKWNFQAMAEAQPVRAQAPPGRPVVSLEEGTLLIKQELAGEAVYRHEMRISGLVIPNEEDPTTVRFQTDVSSAGLRLSVTSGTFDARTGALRFEGQASNIALTPELYKGLPSEVQQVWDRFDPTGSINLKVNFDEQDGLRLATELTGVRFSYEYQGIVHHFENLTGRAIFSPASLQLENVQGLLDKSPTRIEGTISGFSQKHLSVDLSLLAEQVSLEENRKALSGLAEPFDSIYQNYDPKGTVDVSITVKRAGADAELEAAGTVLCRDVSIVYKQFPYRVERLRGPIRFEPQGFTVEKLEGLHGDSPIVITSRVTNPGPAFGADTLITGRRIPLDDDLRGALGEEARKVYDQYHASGAVDLDVHVTREERKDAEMKTAIEGRLLGCTVRHEGFPYEITDTRGDVSISDGKAVIRGITGRHGPAGVELSGEIVPKAGGDAHVRLQVKGTGVAIDEDLEAALPPNDRAGFKVFHLSGQADIEGTVETETKPGSPLTYDLAVDLRGCRMIYEVFPFLAEDLSGRVLLKPGLCRIESLSGYNSRARLKTAGWIEHRPDDFAMDLDVSGEDVPLTKQLRGALGPEVRAAWGHIAPEGRVDVKAHLAKTFGQKPEDLTCRVEVVPRGISATLDFFPYPLQDVQGLLVFEGKKVRMEGLLARDGPTEFAIEGQAVYDDPRGPKVDMTIEARGLRLEGPLRRALPPELQKAMDRLSPAGRVDLKLEELTYRPADGGTADVTWRGTALLDQVALKPGFAMSDLVGTAGVSGRVTGGRLALDGELWLQQGKIAGKDITNTRLAFSKQAASDILDIRTIEGDFYGGRLEGRAAVGMGEPAGSFVLSLAVKDIDLGRLLTEGLRIEHQAKGGRVEATLAAQSRGPNPADLAASGYAHITEAALYELPPMVRLLSALSLRSADRTAFREAQIVYFVSHGKVVLEDIRLFGKAVNLYGAGTIQPDGSLHLTFMSGTKNEKPMSQVLSDILEGVRHEIGIVEVTGTLSNPTVETRSLTELSAPLRELVALIHESHRPKRP